MDPNLSDLSVQLNNVEHCKTSSPKQRKHQVDTVCNLLVSSSKDSPDRISVHTDEDSGYGHTQFSDSKLNGSQFSSSQSGVTNLDETSGLVSYYRDELFQVMTEDVLEWLVKLYPNLTEELNFDNFFDRLSDGVLLCHHATELHNQLLSKVSETTSRSNLRVSGVPVKLPTCAPNYQTRGLQTANATSSFVARINVANFIAWCRYLGMPDSILFESEDLVCKKNPRNVIVCLLELARLGGHLGMAIPELVQLEVEIDEQIAADDFSPVWNNGTQTPGKPDLSNTTLNKDFGVQHNIHILSFDQSTGDDHAEPVCDSMNDNKNGYRINRSAQLRLAKLKNGKQDNKLINKRRDEEVNKQSKPEIKRPTVDLRTLDELVRDLLSQCTCKQTFPMVRIGEGRYLFGDKFTQIFVRILRSHVMVRVGGGWDTLSHFLSKYDECRKANSSSGKADLVDITDKTDLISAVKEASPSLNVSDSKHSSPFLGQGNLNVIKRHCNLNGKSLYNSVGDLSAIPNSKSIQEQPIFDNNISPTTPIKRCQSQQNVNGLIIPRSDGQPYSLVSLKQDLYHSIKNEKTEATEHQHNPKINMEENSTNSLASKRASRSKHNSEYRSRCVRQRSEVVRCNTHKNQVINNIRPLKNFSKPRTTNLNLSRSMESVDLHENRVISKPMHSDTVNGSPRNYIYPHVTMRSQVIPINEIRNHLKTEKKSHCQDLNNRRYNNSHHSNPAKLIYNELSSTTSGLDSGPLLHKEQPDFSGNLHSNQISIKNGINTPPNEDYSNLLRLKPRKGSLIPLPIRSLSGSRIPSTTNSVNFHLVASTNNL